MGIANSKITLPVSLKILPKSLLSTPPKKAYFATYSNETQPLNQLISLNIPEEYGKVTIYPSGSWLEMTPSSTNYDYKINVFPAGLNPGGLQR